MAERRDMVMHNTTRTTLAALSVLSVASIATADFTGLSAELIGVNMVQTVPGQPDQPDTWTARIYAEFSSADQLVSMYGDGANAMLWATDSQFYQNAFGGPTSQGIDEGQFSDLPDLQYDSWLTIGADSQSANALQEVGIGWGGFNNGSPLYVVNGALFTTPDAMQGVAMNDGSGTYRVLIAQLTVFGTPLTKIWGQTNLTWLNSATGDAMNSFVEFSFANIPAPGALALLGLAAISGTRRRR
jgi:hypothetical protein